MRMVHLLFRSATGGRTFIQDGPIIAPHRANFNRERPAEIDYLPPSLTVSGAWAGWSGKGSNAIPAKRLTNSRDIAST